MSVDHRWIECALIDHPTNEAPIPWSIHAEQRPHGPVVVVEINVRTGSTDESIVAEGRTADSAITKALTALHRVGL